MNRGRWPYPGDSPLVRARRVAHAYRAALEIHARSACAEVDRRVNEWGERWAVPTLITREYHPDQWLTPSEAAELACVDVATIRQLRLRKRLTGRHNGAHWEYRARDVMALSGKSRGRRATATDTLPSSGTTVPETRPAADA